MSEDPAMFHLDDPALSVERPEVAGMLARLRPVLGVPYSADTWAAQQWLSRPGELTCDGGALALALACRASGIPAQLCVGLYRHHDPQLRAALMGDEPDLH